MTAKEKAKELIDSFGGTHDVGRSHAIICVDEILNNLESLHTIFMSEYTRVVNYWKEVKQEIEKL